MQLTPQQVILITVKHYCDQATQQTQALQENAYSADRQHLSGQLAAFQQVSNLCQTLLNFTHPEPTPSASTVTENP